jgi:hypothetical protein
MGRMSVTEHQLSTEMPLVAEPPAEPPPGTGETDHPPG